MTFLICAAGAGTRMNAVHPLIPKPLLKLHGQTFLAHAVSSLPLEKGDRVVIVGQKQHRLRRAESELLYCSNQARFEWLEIDGLTRGALETALFASVDINEGFGIFNADSVFQCDGLRGLAYQCEGLIPCSVENGDSWSFCEIEDDSLPIKRVTRVTEKLRISQWCSVGFYWFLNPQKFREFAEIEIANQQQTELYVAPLYNRYISEGLDVQAVPVELFKAMGTPEQLQTYWGLSIEDLQRENRHSPFV